jgi:hypothetical protein
MRIYTRAKLLLTLELRNYFRPLDRRFLNDALSSPARTKRLLLRLAVRRQTSYWNQTRFSNIDREMLAVVQGLEKFHFYAYGRHVIIELNWSGYMAAGRVLLTSDFFDFFNFKIDANLYKFGIKLFLNTPLFCGYILCVGNSSFHTFIVDRLIVLVWVERLQTALSLD